MPKIIMSKLKIQVRYFQWFLTTVILSKKTWNYFFEFLGEFSRVKVCRKVFQLSFFWLMENSWHCCCCWDLKGVLGNFSGESHFTNGQMWWCKQASLMHFITKNFWISTKLHWISTKLHWILYSQTRGGSSIIILLHLPSLPLHRNFNFSILAWNMVVSCFHKKPNLKVQ